MKECLNCGRENADDCKFCLSCGSMLPKVEAPPVVEPELTDCPHCGTPVPGAYKFCGACGGSTKSSVPAAIPAFKAPEPEGVTVATPGVTNPPPYHPERTLNSAPSADVAPSFNPLSSAPSLGNAVAKLVVIRPDGTEGATIPLREGEVIVGRNSDYPVLASDMFLSPQHAALTSQDGRFMIRDHDSLNGVFYRLKGEVELQHGDMIRLGQELLLFEVMERVNPSTAVLPKDDTHLGGSPDVGYWGKLSLIGGPDTVTRAFVLKDDEITIGREIGDIVFRDDGFVSGRHARLFKRQGQFVLKDLNSSNGTYIRIRRERELSDGDLILMGQQLFRLVG